MKIDVVIGLIPALFAGVILGVIFFGGLWLTVQKGLRSKMTGLVFMGSFIVRMAIIVLGFYYVGADNWQKMMVCLGGFLLARIAITHITQKQDRSKSALIKEVSDEN